MLHTPSISNEEPQIKAVFFDIDGTLISFKTNAIPESTKLAIKQLREKNIKIIIATGRSINAIDHVKDLEFDGFICFNGGCCVTVDGTVLHRQSILPADIQGLLDYSEKHPLSFALMYEDSIQINDNAPEIVGMYAHLNLPVPPLMDRKDTNIDRVLQANIFLSPDKEQEFMDTIMPNSVATRWTPLFADINCNGLSKEVGVITFCEHFGIDVKETMSFGDGGNDIKMLEYTQIGVAMGNANQNVKDIADYVTDDVDNDGILKALLYHKVI
ncbi:Cof-type HAD-IIB family hydrolase [Pedobacter sp. AW31-3R]|uniref:Cof-type HAD-IIB family hydrolase n=1 Tax=Pedobacter sp. AW31-3R TaxID=3445781 RepID=UPI003F9F718B